MGPRSFFGRVQGAAGQGSGILGAGWVRPAWLERQIDLHGASFRPQATHSGLQNIFDRSWTGVGNIGSPHRAIVDPSGLVTPVPAGRAHDGWSVDWWIGAEDRWHFPSRETAVRQGLVGTAPVVETLVRVPGGDAVCRTYTVVGPAGVGDLAIMEVENRSAVPFAVGFAIRPYNQEGVAAVGRIELDDANVVLVDGVAAMFLPRPPSASAGSNLAGGDVAAQVPDGLSSELFTGARCRDGFAQAVFVFPLSHTSSIRVGIPLTPAGRTTERPDASVLPSARDVARAWDAQSRRGMRVTLPPGRIAEAFEANRKHLLLSFTGDDVIGGPAQPAAPSLPDTALLLQALDSLGFAAEVLDVINGTIARPTAGGDFGLDDDDPAANGAAIAAIASHWRTTRNEELPVAVRDAVVSAGQLLSRSRHPGRRAKRRTGDPEVSGLLPARGATGFFYADDFWAVRGLVDGAELLRSAGDRDAADALAGEATALERDLRRSLSAVAARTGTSAIPSGPGRRSDPGTGEGLLASALRLLPPHDRRITATLDTVRAASGAGPAVPDTIGHTGLSPSLTLQVAATEVARGDLRALDRLRWMLEVASDTYSWPESVHPRHRGGTAGDGQDLRVSARFVLLVRSLLLQESVGEELVLFPMVPAEWEGQGLEVHDAPTEYGRLSCALRWHGPRPALLWDLDVHPGVGPVTLRAPALDPAWSTQAVKGEALLAPRRVEAIVAPGSFS